MTVSCHKLEHTLVEYVYFEKILGNLAKLFQS
jgi:hypothetical protein